MGILLDSSVLIAAERRSEAPLALMNRVRSICGDDRIALSAIGYTELVHGIYRKDTLVRRQLSRFFIDGLAAQLPVLSYTKEVAEIAGRIDAEQRLAGFAVPFADLLIGATALHHGFAILTSNIRHYELIPQLRVIPF